MIWTRDTLSAEIDRIEVEETQLSGHERIVLWLFQCWIINTLSEADEYSPEILSELVDRIRSLLLNDIFEELEKRRGFNREKMLEAFGHEANQRTIHKIGSHIRQMDPDAQELNDTIVFFRQILKHGLSIFLNCQGITAEEI